MRIGIFFGGASREREISFAGGRTVYDNLDKNLFDPVPIFVDSIGNLILLDWKYVYKGTIRDFYPPANMLPPSPHSFQIYAESLGDLSSQDVDRMIASVGKKIQFHELKELIDFAFLSLHGAWGEDGTIQGILEWLNIPYSGSGILPSAIGMNKAFQKELMKKSGFDVAKSMVIRRVEWEIDKNHKKTFSDAIRKIGLPLVVRPANQGSSIGVSIVRKKPRDHFEQAVDAAFFIRRLSAAEWSSFSGEEKTDWVRTVSEIKDGTGIPFVVNGERINHPEQLLDYIQKYFASADKDASIILSSVYEEQEVVLESFIEGIEFSCIVIRNENGEPVALPPTEIKKGGEVFDYRSKYLAGMTRKVTPINLPDNQVMKIRKACEQLFNFFGFHVYARIDGFTRKDKKIFLNDPNTTSGMLPSSFFFHQAAEIGLNPSQFLTYIIRASLEERIHSQSLTAGYKSLLKNLDEKISNLKKQSFNKKKIGVIFGGYSSERHISVESGRNIFEKLSSSIKYEPIPFFLLGNPNITDAEQQEYSLWQIPVNLLLKDNADDIRDKILHFRKHPVVEKIRKQCKELTKRYASSSLVFDPRKVSLEELTGIVDGVFIALHGRPGEDGRLQSDLEKLGLPYNGSGVISSEITINKYETNEILQQHGFKIANHMLMQKADWLKDKNHFYKHVTSQIPFPFICKPVDDGCSSAVKKIHSLEELDAFCNLMFREQDYACLRNMHKSFS
jgi:D-alanine-D-alanine ligase